MNQEERFLEQCSCCHKLTEHRIIDTKKRGGKVQLLCCKCHHIKRGFFELNKLNLVKKEKRK